MTPLDSILIQRSAAELERHAEEHGLLLARVLGNGSAVQAAPCLDLHEPCRRKLGGVLAEVIEVLEVSRKAFKSKRLEVLRKKMIGILAEPGK